MTFVYMKHLMTMNEMVKNPNLVKLTLKRMLIELNYLGLNLKLFDSDRTYEIYLTYRLLKKPIELLPNVLKIIDKYKKEFLKIDYILSYEQEVYIDDVLSDDLLKYVKKEIFDICIYIKNSKSIRIKPNKYIYHYSHQKNRKEISLKGLIPQSWKNSDEWKNEPSLEYEDAIFAINSKKTIWDNKYDCWQIDTTNLKNKWWTDLNFKNTTHIMTFEPIPPEFLTLL